MARRRKDSLRAAQKRAQRLKKEVEALRSGQTEKALQAHIQMHERLEPSQTCKGLAAAVECGKDGNFRADGKKLGTDEWYTKPAPGQKYKMYSDMADEASKDYSVTFRYIPDLNAPVTSEELTLLRDRLLGEIRKAVLARCGQPDPMEYEHSWQVSLCCSVEEAIRSLAREGK